MQACRQSGRGEQRRQIQQELYDEALAAQAATSAAVARPTVTSTLPAQAVVSAAAAASTSSVHQVWTPATSAGVSNGYPAGYHGDSSHGDSSSLSMGGVTNDTEFDSVSPTWHMEDFPDLTSVRMSFSETRLSPTNWLEAPIATTRGTYPLPPLPPVESYTQTERMDLQDRGCDVRPLPRPWLEPPHITTRILADQAAAVMSSDFNAAASSIAERLLGLLPSPITPGERRSIRLAVSFASEAQRSMGNRLLGLLGLLML